MCLVIMNILLVGNRHHHRLFIVHYFKSMTRAYRFALLSYATELTGLVSVSVSYSLVSVLALVSLCSGLINKPGSNVIGY